jgi:hypothetical protein
MTTKNLKAFIALLKDNDFFVRDYAEDGYYPSLGSRPSSLPPEVMVDAVADALFRELCKYDSGNLAPALSMTIGDFVGLYAQANPGSRDLRGDVK